MSFEMTFGGYFSCIRFQVFLPAHFIKDFDLFNCNLHPFICVEALNLFEEVTVYLVAVGYRFYTLFFTNLQNL
ncbi:MAG: hypothetical protein ACI9V1_003595 [Spirosomataceae bacterium]|jgi:hypothetical protein